MWPESSEHAKPLRSGLTTGTCATACCVAATQALLANKQPPEVEVTLPRGKVVSLKIEGYEQLECLIAARTGHSPEKRAEPGPEQMPAIRTSTIKDAGDDPDVTHGARVFVELSLTEAPGVQFCSAQGVGTVTREGLVLEVGEPAINPVPREMMQGHLQRAAEVYGYQGGFKVAVGVVNGEALALKTMNPKLGILGGLSILGTTGIVRPFSCAAYIASIHQGMDVAKANGIEHIAASTGSTSEAAIMAAYQLSDTALIEMGDFVGAVLKHLRKLPIGKVSICGGFGKVSKLANGHMDLNSRASSIDFEQLAGIAAAQGANSALQHQIKQANTSMQVLKLCQNQGIDLAQPVCDAALAVAVERLGEQARARTELEVWAVDRKGAVLATASSTKQTQHSKGP